MATNRTTIAWAFALLLGLAVAPLTSCSGPCDEKLNCGTPNPQGGSAGASTGGNGEAGGSSGGGKGGAASGGSTNMAGDGGSDAGAGGLPVVPCGGDCPSGKPVCNESTDTCVQCLAPEDCTAGTKTKCDTTNNTCVECLAPGDCPSATAARCDAGVCAKCTTNDDCSHIDGKGVCDGDGTCVQCTVADENACLGKSCNPASKACTATTIGSIGTCEPCVADSECVGGNQADPDSRCVPMEFEGVARPGGFCLRRVAKTCVRPYKIPITKESLSGAASEAYCGIDQESTRCEAVLDLQSSAACADGMDSSCGCARDGDGACTEAGAGGLCRIVGVDLNRCTYPCGVADHCPTGTTCLPDNYCH